MQEAIEQLQKPIDELTHLNDRLAELIIKNAINDYENSMRDRLIERLNQKIAEGAITGAIDGENNYKHSLALIIDEAQTREEEGEAFAQKIEGVVVMIGDPDNPGPDTVYGAVKDVMTAFATENEVTGQRINEIITSIGDPSNPTAESVYGAIRTEENARTTLEEVTTERFDTMTSIIGNPEDPQPGTAFGAIHEESETRATKLEAEANQRKQLESQVNTELGRVNAAILQESVTRANQDSSLSQYITTVQGQLNGNMASVQQLMQVIDGIKTMWSVKLDVNGYITGLVMNNQGEGKSSTVFHTDTFLVGKPGVNGGDPQYAFVIGTVNGRYQVSMNSAFIQDLAVDTLKIKGRSVTVPSVLSGFPFLKGRFKSCWV